MSLMFSSRQATACATYRPLPGVEICADCRWSGAAHQADTSQPPVTRDGVTTQVVKRAAILTPDVSGMVLDSPAILAAVETVRLAVATRTALRLVCDEAQAARVALPSGKGSSPVRMRAVRAIEAAFAADDDVSACRSDVERAVRTANRGATEAQIQAACRSL